VTFVFKAFDFLGDSVVKRVWPELLRETKAAESESNLSL